MDYACPLVIVIIDLLLLNAFLQVLMLIILWKIIRKNFANRRNVFLNYNVTQRFRDISKPSSIKTSLIFQFIVWRFFFLLFIFCEWLLSGLRVDLILTILQIFFMDFAQRRLEVDPYALRTTQLLGRLVLYDAELVIEAVVHKTISESMD